jgi:hypothetical protein
MYLVPGGDLLLRDAEERARALVLPRPEVFPAVDKYTPRAHSAHRVVPIYNTALYFYAASKKSPHKPGGHFWKRYFT